MYKKSVQKLGVLNRISSFLEPGKKKLVFNAVMKSHFSYYLLIWMFSRILSPFYFLYIRLFPKIILMAEENGGNIIREMMFPNRYLTPDILSH